MREILFRGKRIANGEWVYGLLCRVGDTYANIVDKDTEVIYSVLTNTIGQFTGLTDKNGKKIFEGDIVRYKTEPCCTYQVVFENRNGSAYFGIVIDKNETWGFGNEVPARLLEVIGNIHDNPGLMGAEQ